MWQKISGKKNCHKKIATNFEIMRGSKIIKDIRAFYNFSQSHLASILGITRTQLSMAEIGERTLSTDAMLKLAALYTAIGNSAKRRQPKEITKRLQQQEDKAARLAKVMLADKKYKYALLARQLNKMKLAHEHAVNLLFSLHTATPAFTFKAKDIQQQLFTKCESNALQTLQKTAKEKQLQLECKLAGLKAEIDLITERGKLEKNN